MCGFELGEKLPYGLEPSLLFVFEALTNSFFGVSLGGNVEQPLISLGILHDCRGLPIDRQHHGALAFLQVLDEVA